MKSSQDQALVPQPHDLELTSSLPGTLGSPSKPLVTVRDELEDARTDGEAGPLPGSSISHVQLTKKLDSQPLSKNLEVVQEDELVPESARGRLTQKEASRMLHSQGTAQRSLSRK